MGFASENESGKQLRQSPDIIKDKNRCLRLEIKRDHPFLVQHSKVHTHPWRANGDMPSILSSSGPYSPSVEEILAVEKYTTAYSCKGNQSTESLTNLFHEMLNTSSKAQNFMILYADPEGFQYFLPICKRHLP